MAKVTLGCRTGSDGREQLAVIDLVCHRRHQAPAVCWLASAQVARERQELLPEVAPPSDRIRIQRPADLDGACRSDNALPCMKLQTRRFPRKSAMSQYSARHRLLICHQILVLHREKTFTQDCLPVPDQRMPRYVIMSEVDQIVRERVSVREKCLVHGIAGIGWLASQND